MTDMKEFEVRFSMDGTIIVRAESDDSAELEAISALQDAQFYCEDTDVDSCVVKVVGRWDDADDPFRDLDDRVPVDRQPRATEFFS